MDGSSCRIRSDRLTTCLPVADSWIDEDGMDERTSEHANERVSERARHLASH